MKISRKPYQAEPTPDEPGFISASEIAKIYGINEDTVHNAISLGGKQFNFQIPANGITYIYVEDMPDFSEALKNVIDSITKYRFL